ncbi:phosphodiester glycosidase family protein [Moraxella oblonga]|uniref:phosphodiester glycosidase family protein n=1 Tax=Moraxella oblonga TaxID=200413 RepID=UPI000A0104F1|nr:phosphodiester glycosidase family protein [Moraxella oblonga]
MPTIFILCILSSLILIGGCDNKPNLKNTPCTALTTPFAHTRCVADNADGLSLHWQSNDKSTLYTFERLIATQGDVTFAMNAGMYDQAFAPIGYTAINGNIIKPLNTNDGEGNFHLMPNGVFWWNHEGTFVDTTPAFANKLAQGIKPTYATQSGPMLVIDGQIHPRFDPKSTSYKIRNGVGVDCTDKRTHFIISDEAVNFYQFANVFKQDLGCQNALFLDGGIASALYAKNLNRHDKLNMAVMVAFKDNQ